ATKRQPRHVSRLVLADLTAEDVIAFLDHIEKDRHATISTRNCRLAALHSFFRFVASREPLAAKQCESVLRIPVKRGPTRSPTYLESEEVWAVLAQPDCHTLLGERDSTLLVFLYKRGARISEALALCPIVMRLAKPSP